jgi:hypothetical protein
MKKVINQHGDLLLQRVDAIPKGAKKLNVSNGYVLEKGEGVHTHVLENVNGVSVYEHEGKIYLKVDKTTTINHEEHGRQTLAPGIYEKNIERVWDYESEEARRTID